jgi:hypothetical protein
MILGFLALCVFARLAEGHGWSIIDHHLTSAQWYDVVRSTIASVGVFGIGAAGLLAYRRQKTSEAMERISHATQQVAADQQKVAADQHQLERDRHQLSVQLREDSSTVDLRARFATAAGQLGHASAAVRLAGVYAMAALADDWHTANDDIQMQVCIDVLCAYLRIPYDPDSAATPAGEREVRLTVISVIRDHLQDPTTTTWCGRNLDFTGATFDGGSFTGAKFTGGTVTFTGATFSGAVDFRLAEFSGGDVDFNQAEFSGGYVNFSAAVFSGGTVTFNRAKFSGGDVDFARPLDWNPGPTVDWTDTAPDGVTPTDWPPAPTASDPEGAA